MKRPCSGSVRVFWYSPEGGDVLSFVLTEGRQAAKPYFKAVLTLKDLCEQYEAGSAARSMEVTSLETVKLHLKHFKRVLKDKFPVQTLTDSTLQSYVDHRSQEWGHRGRRLSPITIKKEITSFSGVWSWGVRTGLLKGTFPSKGLDYPKTAEKPPFRTFAEIERQVARGGLTEHEEAALWECLFLTLPEVEELLRFVRDHAGYPFLYPMVCTAAHTGPAGVNSSGRSSMTSTSRGRRFSFARRRGPKAKSPSAECPCRRCSPRS